MDRIVWLGSNLSIFEISSFLPIHTLSVQMFAKEKPNRTLSIHKYLFIVFMGQVNYKPNLKLIYFDVAEN